MAELESILVRTLELMEHEKGDVEGKTFQAPVFGEVTVRDVTSVFYDFSTDAKGKVTAKLSKAAEIQNSTIDLETVYPDLKDGSKKQVIKATLGTDTPIRNAMAAMADPDTKVLLTTSVVSEKLLAYQTIFIYKGDAAIFSGHYSRIIYSL
jgi:hypothetical protein